MSSKSSFSSHQFPLGKTIKAMRPGLSLAFLCTLTACGTQEVEPSDGRSPERPAHTGARPSQALPPEPPHPDEVDIPESTSPPVVADEDLTGKTDEGAGEPTSSAHPERTATAQPMPTFPSAPTPTIAPTRTPMPMPMPMPMPTRTPTPTPVATASPVPSAWIRSFGKGGPIGHTVHTIGQVELKVWTPSAQKLATGPKQIYLYLHGDTAGDYQSQNATLELRSYVLSRGLIFASALAPNKYSWWGHDGFVTKEAINGFNGVMKTLTAWYDVYTNGTIVHGVSGGSTGQTMWLYPGGMDTWVRASFLDCGGAAGGNMRLWKPSAATISRMKFFVTYGDQDFLGPAGSGVIGQAMARLRLLGFTPKERVYANTTHCAFNRTKHVKEELPALIIGSQ